MLVALDYHELVMYFLQKMLPNLKPRRVHSSFLPVIERLIEGKHQNSFALKRTKHFYFLTSLLRRFVNDNVLLCPLTDRQISEYAATIE